MRLTAVGAVMLTKFGSGTAATFIVIVTVSDTPPVLVIVPGRVTVPVAVAVWAVVVAALKPVTAPHVTSAVVGDPAGSTTIPTVVGKLHVPAVAWA